MQVFPSATAPPASPDQAWDVKQLIGTPVSDAVLCDFDNDGEDELACISPFHGDTLTIYKKDAPGGYHPVFQAPRPLEMIHAIWAGKLQNRNVLVIGHRKGARDTLLISYAEGRYQIELLDHDVGAANVLHFRNRHGQDVILAANREIDEIAMYTITE